MLVPAVHPKGYERVGLSATTGSRRKHLLVHALVLSAFVGPRPPGLEIRHLDGNPRHNDLSNLAYGTTSENARDRVRHGTHPDAAKTQCIRGHEFTAENTYRRPNGDRTCLTCKRESERSRWPERARRRIIARADRLAATRESS
jgi:hypothetical protein